MSDANVGREVEAGEAGVMYGLWWPRPLPAQAVAKVWEQRARQMPMTTKDPRD